MGQDIRSKLAMYKETGAKKTEPAAKAGSDVHDLLEGKVCNNDYGSFFIIEKEFPVSFSHGECILGDALDVYMPLLKKLCCDVDENCNISDFLFLDTETTGLSGGAGTVAFLIGAGFFKDNAFYLKQYFMRDYNEEPAVLKAFNELLSRAKGLITFNGKAFDWNLLQNRYIFNRERPSLRNPVHLDLLFPSRRIWGLKLESCRLSSLEENILGGQRSDDVPGALIPSIYFKYLQERDAADIKKVILHNELDILSMVSLLVRITKMLGNPLAETDGSHELLGLGKIFEKSGEYDMVVNCFESCINSESPAVKEAALKSLTGIYKRGGKFERALYHWENTLPGSGSLSVFSAVEMAKYYEHKVKDIPKAVEMAERAMELCLKAGYRNNLYYEDLKKRLDRLKRKSGRNMGGPC